MESGLILTAATEKRLFEQTILLPLLSGENLTIMWVPHGGRRKTMVYLARNAEKFGFNQLGKYQIHYLDHDELSEETPLAYFQLILKNITGNTTFNHNSDQEPFYRLRDAITDLLKQNIHLVFILGRFDELNLPTFFFNNLYSLWQLDKTKVHFIFAITKNIFQEDIFRQYGQLREALSQNLIYFPIHQADDSSTLTEILVQKYGYKLTPAKKALAKILGGGHPSLTKACLRIFNNFPNLKENQSPDYILQQWETKTILEDIWQNFSEDEKACLSMIAKDKHCKSESLSSPLLQLRIVASSKESGPKLFSPLFETFVSSQKVKTRTLNIDPQSGEILINGFPPREKISLQEYHLLATFLSKPQIVLSRDQIGDILWGKGSYEKYSDWAIDQIVSQLRKKLEKLGISSKNLQTIRGRGYRWIG